MKALVTGATGFVGSHLADLLKSSGLDVRCLHRASSDLRWLEGKGFELVEGSLYDKDSLKRAVEGVDYVYHAAGLIAARDEEEFMRGNRDATRALFEAALEKAPNLKRFLYVSSQTAAGPARSLSEPVDENATPAPITAYGRSKRAAEEYLEGHFDKLPVTIARPPAVYGPRDLALVPLFKFAKLGFATLIGFGEKYVSLIYVEDLVRGLKLAAESDKSIGEKYFLSSENFYTWNELLTAMGKAAGKKRVVKLKLPHFVVFAAGGLSEFFGKFSKKPPVFNFDKAKDFTQTYWICSVEKAKRDLGFRQLTDIETGLEKTMRWYIESGWI